MLLCHWDHPGADRYTGTTAAAIHAFVVIPRDVQDRLIVAHDKDPIGSAVDTVVIDRDSIRGKVFEYAPEIRNMHTGSNGELCGTMLRDRWTSSHVETALVYCDSGYCVAWPAVCGNWFQIAVLSSLYVPPPVLPLAYDVLPATYLPDAVPTPVPGYVPPLYPDEAAPGAWYGAPPLYFAGGGFAYLPCPACCATVPPVAAVPENSTWSSLLAGIAALVLLFLHRRKV